MTSARFIGSEIYRGSSYGARHPLAIPRVSTCMDLCRALGWLPDDLYLTSPIASPAQLSRFHHPDYIWAVRAAEAAQKAPKEVRERHHIGRNGNPIYPEVFRRPATACGGSLLASDLLSDPSQGIKIVFNPAGGTHHGRPARASGFCYFNDPVLAILDLLDRGWERVFYLDLDAHHGDGVQAALSHDPRVMTFSIHEDGRWPMTETGEGTSTDRGGGQARNIPVPAGFNDNEMDFIGEAAVLPLIRDFSPGVVVIQCGCDALMEDPQSRLALSNLALWKMVDRVKGLGYPLLVLGGGGYNPWAVGRCWSGIWGVLTGQRMPAVLPPAAQKLLRDLTWRHRLGRNPPEEWMTTLADRPRPGAVRDHVKAVVEAVVSGK
ncbi:MAG: acetoin utilization protein AcuC [Pseudomonadota bacterium]